MENKRKKYLIDISIISLMTALIAVSAQLTIPLPSGVPVTLQTFTVALSGYVLGTKRSVVSVAVYVLLGLVGVPVFSGFKAGTAALFGQTGGFVFGFVFLVLACGIAAKPKKLLPKAFVGIVGLLLCHLCGTLWFVFITKTSFVASVATVSLPFIAKDIVCVVCSALLSERLRRFVK